MMSLKFLGVFLCINDMIDFSVHKSHLCMISSGKLDHRVVRLVQDTSSKKLRNQVV